MVWYVQMKQVEIEPIAGADTVAPVVGEFNYHDWFQAGQLILDYSAELSAQGRTYPETLLFPPAAVDVAKSVKAELESGVDVLEGPSGQKLATQTLNKGAGKSMLWLPAWSVEIDRPAFQHQMGIIATRLPEVEILAVQTLGTGRSSKPSMSASSQLRRTGSFGAVGREVAEILDSNGKQFDYGVGASMGTRSLLGYFMHSQLANHAELILDDPLGATEYPLFEFGLGRFMGLEGKYTEPVLAESDDEIAIQLQKDGLKPSVIVKAIGRQVARRQLYHQWVAQVSAMRKATLKHDIINAQKNTSGLTIHANIPTASAVSDTMADLALFDEINAMPCVNGNGIVVSHLLPGATHGHGVANAPTEAEIIRHLLRLEANQS